MHDSLQEIQFAIELVHVTFSERREKAKKHFQEVPLAEDQHLQVGDGDARKEPFAVLVGLQVPENASRLVDSDGHPVVLCPSQHGAARLHEVNFVGRVVGLVDELVLGLEGWEPTSQESRFLEAVSDRVDDFRLQVLEKGEVVEQLRVNVELQISSQRLRKLFEKREQVKGVASILLFKQRHFCVFESRRQQGVLFLDFVEHGQFGGKVHVLLDGVHNNGVDVTQHKVEVDHSDQHQKNHNHSFQSGASRYSKSRLLKGVFPIADCDHSFDHPVQRVQVLFKDWVVF